ncbi:MAG: acyl-CoA dehydrogenase family protein [Pseudomonadota bacterium]
MKAFPNDGTSDPRLAAPAHNQPPLLVDESRVDEDPALISAVHAAGADWALAPLRAVAAWLAREASLQLAERANENPPELNQFGRLGPAEQAVRFDPAWHELIAPQISAGAVATSWQEERPGAHSARGALMYLAVQTEAGTQCPISMSHGAVPVLRRNANVDPGIEQIWLSRILSREYDARSLPAAEKTGALLGMGMTERQGGSDVRRNETHATSEGGVNYRLNGHKWFFSAPSCDGFLVLAQASAGITCFLVPRLTDAGRSNGLQLVRLKSKLGNRSNASSEVNFVDARGIRLGDEGRGVREIIEMATHTRVDCALATAGMMRRGLTVCLHHARSRVAFGRCLVDQPLMRNVLADLALESEAATRLALFAAGTFDQAEGSVAFELGRMLIPATKYHLGKRGPGFLAEAMEVLGGNGYVEEWELPRLYRELPLLSIWEGSGNVMCLDVLRSAARSPATIDALAEFLAPLAALGPAMAKSTGELVTAARGSDETAGRRLAHRIALHCQAALLAHAQSPGTEAFIASRLTSGAGWGDAYGTLPVLPDAGYLNYAFRQA